MGDKFEKFGEKEEQQSSKRKLSSYIPWKLDFKRQEKKDKDDADVLLMQITGETTSKGNRRERGSKQKITTDTLRNMPRGKIDDNTLGFVQNGMDRFNIQRREDEYLAQHEKMSEGEYNRLFSGKERLKQGQFGDCYLVSGINELARAQHFDTLMRTSIQRMKRSNGDIGYQIQIPLGEPSGRKILIKNSELSIAKIKGSDGYKLLELAYAKNRRPNNRGGNKYSPITHEEFAKIKGGWPHEVLEKFLGKKNIGFSDFGTMKNYSSGKTLSQSSEGAKKEIYNFLKNYNPQIGNKFVSLASLHGSSDGKSYVIGGKTLYRKHAYSITGIKKEKGEVKSITVLNPWNSGGAGKNYQDFTVDEFFQAFSAMGCGTINRQTFLDNKSMS